MTKCAMTKSELVAQLVEQFPQFSLKHADAGVRVILDALADALAAGHRIEIRGFCSFSLRRRAPREARNPKSGKKVYVPEKYAPYFRAGSKLRKQVGSEI